MSADFLAGGGEMGGRMRAFDWASSALGPAPSWPNSLRTALSIVLGSRYPMFVWWGGSLINFYNDAYIPVLGKRHPQALGRPAREVWSEIWDVLGPQAEAVLKTGRATWNDRQLLVMERNGYTEETYFSWSYSPVTDESGAVNGVFCACTEDTARVLSERRLQTLSDLGARAAEVSDANAACEKAAAEIGKNPSDIPFAAIYLVEEGAARARLAGGARVEEHRGLFPPSLALDGGPWPFAGVAASREARLVRDVAALERIPAMPWPEAVEQAMVLPIAAAGEDRPTGFLIAGVSPRRVLDEDYRRFLDLVAGHIARTLADARAYEAQKRRAEALAEIDRAKTAFFSNVSHEFRTPLTLMLGPVEDALADAGAPLPPAQRERLELARRNALRLQKLVNALLDFSRIEAGRVRASYEPTDLAALTADLASNFRAAVDKAGLELAVDCQPVGEPVYVDRDMWEKVVLNLLSNAFKFTFAGRISVSVRRAAGAVEMSVRDTGTGIPASELPHIFERFRRVEGARSRTHEGTGIGLALVQELVRLHGGSVRVDSALREGSVFTVSLPLGKAHLPAERISAPPAPAGTAAGIASFVEESLGWLPDAPAAQEAGAPGRPRVVLADDNADMREYVARLLGARYEVEAVADGQAALDAVRARRPELVLADVMMPKLDGLGLVRALRADVQSRSIPVILLSARAGEESRIEGLDAGADAYLFKPFSGRELLAQVAARLELSRLQQRLQQERADLADLFRQTPVPTAVLSGPELVFEMANPAYLEAVGGRSILGRPILHALPELEGQGFDELLRQVMRSGRPHVGHETPVRLERDGRVTERYFTYIYAPLRNAGGDTDRVIAIVNEVSEQVQARIQIERLAADAMAEQRKYRTLIESIDEGFCVVEVMLDAQGAAADYRFVEVNPAFERHTGLVAAVGRTARDLIPGHDAFWFETYARVALSGRPERFQRYAEAMGRWFDVFCSRIGPPEERRVAIVFNDITERKAAEAALKDADRRKDEFIATLSHELRNPLAPLRHALDLLRLSGAHGAAAPTLEIMERQVGHLARLVDDLLEMSRITRGAFELRRERLEVSAVVANAVETSGPSIRAAQHRLVLALAGEPLWVDGDAVRLAQILANLLDNAAKYTPPGGEITVSARQAGGAVEVCVRDNGEGISAEALPRLFQMFSRGDRVAGRGHGGLGIGLALARHLAGMHGGTLEARSAGTGAGAEFILRLPAAEAKPAHREPAWPAGARLPAKRVLVVDDNRDAAESLAAVLELLGADVRVAHAGHDAIEQAQAYAPSVVLLDLGMPGMDGYEVARRLRGQRREVPLSIVALTGWGQDEDRRRTLEAGFDHHLIKPADMNQLQSLLASLP